MTPSGDKRSGSTLAQVMAFCLTAPSHYLNQCLLIINKIKSSDIHLRASSQEITQPSITEIIWKIKCLTFHSNFPGANEIKIAIAWMIFDIPYARHPLWIPADNG